MQRPRLVLLNAAHEGELTRRNFRRELAADLVEFHVTDGQQPPAVDTWVDGPPYDGLVVTGSRSSVYWDEDWIAPTREWVRDAVDAGLPALGVCYGHQLLADALGGTVEDMGEYELGYRTVTHRGSRLFAGVPEEFLVFTTHSDTVTAVPPGATVTAENDYGVHGYRRGHVFGVQFHPEYDVETARAVVENKDVDEAWKRELLAGITDEAFAEACAAKAVFDNFVDYVEEVRGVGGRDARAAADD